MSNSDSFIRDLIKGKIVEAIFYNMFVEKGEYRVIPLGYEYTLPELVLEQYKEHREILDKVTENLRDSPDFLLISNSGNSIYLVEVKYRKTKDPTEMLEIARQERKHWNYSWIFLATRDNFYFQSCNQIVENDGDIQPFNWKGISEESIHKHKQLLLEFIRE